ncbi:MAG TPA: hypothetical protein VFP34_17150 [Microlunatus sp.]|nr:hypothetical protein [Microlunatus sp.]
MLRAARLWLQMATAERTTLAQARALATVNVALALVDERLRPELRGRGDAVPGEVP